MNRRLLSSNLGFAAALAILLVIGLKARQSNHDLLNTFQDRSQSRRTLIAIGDVISDLSDAETGQRGFLLTGKETYLKPYLDAERDVQKDLAVLEELTRGRPSQAERFAALKDLSIRKLAELKEVIRLKRTISMTAALELMNTDRGQAMMDQSRELVRQMSEYEQAGLVENGQKADEVRGSASLLVALGSLAAFLSLAGAAFLINRDSRRRIRAEAQLKDLNEELSRRVMESTEALRGTVRELEAQRGLLTTVLNNAPIILWAIDEKWNFTIAEGRGLVDLSSAPGVLVGASYREFNNNNPSGIEAVERVFLGQEGYAISERQGVWWETHRSPIKNRDGRVVGVVGVSTNVTDRRRMEDTVRQNEKKLKTLTEALPQMVWTADRTGRLDYCNQRWLEYTGIVAERMMSEGWTSAVHKDDLKVSEEHWASALSTESSYEVRLRLKRVSDGAYRWHLARAQPFHDERGVLAQWFGTCTDIHDQEEAYRMLLESEARTAAVINNASLILWSLDKDGIYTFMQGKGLEPIKLGQHERIGKSMFDVNKDRPELLESVRGALRGEASKVLEKVGEIWFDILCSPMKAASGEIVGVAGASLDVTARILADKAYKESETERTEALSREKAAIQASEIKSGFLANMSHEIRTPMNAIIGMAELLSETPLNFEQKRYVDSFRRAGDNLLDLMNDILDISKIESGNFAVDHIEFDLNELIENTGELLAPKAHAKGLELALMIRPDVPTAVLGDPNRLRQILANLLGNAIKFTEKGEVVLLVEKCRGPQAADGILFSIRDTGRGIPASKIPLLFERFSQLDNSITRNYGGTGLGLNISKQLVGLMHGKIGVESVEGRGSCFFFSLPLKSQILPHPEVARHELKMEGRRALIVDDNATNRLILTDTLKFWGARVTEAENGAAALRAIEVARQQGNPFDLMLLDFRMPGMDGFEVAEAVRGREKAQPDAPSGMVMMMLSSDNRSGAMSRCRGLGIASMLIKPVKRTELWNALKAVLAPQTARNIAAPAKAELPAPDTQKRLRILMVDDSEDNRDLLMFHLKKTPHHLDVAENGEQAVNKVKAADFDLVLMDMQMPVLDGYSATREIRIWEKAQGRKPVRIVALTAYALKEETLKSLDAGCDSHMTKPIKKAALLKILEDAALASSQLAA